MFWRGWKFLEPSSNLGEVTPKSEKIKSTKGKKNGMKKLIFSLVGQKKVLKHKIDKKSFPPVTLKFQRLSRGSKEEGFEY